jgi:membrane protein implicated in regulation of membrane protease activity
MDHGIIWAVIGLVLVIVELLTGTFYLLMLGLAAFGAAAAAWLGLAFASQSIVAALVAVVGPRTTPSSAWTASSTTR